tara:strand:+ start:449 stop:1420 length:972 start_codon:yes stop_codon:yes gene_type:complete
MENSKITNFKKYVMLKGDASFRKFYRKKNKKGTSIIVFATKDKEKNLLDYVSVNKLLNKNGILAPNLISENYNNNFIEIEDLGNKTVFNILKKNNKYKIFLNILKKLIKIQKIKTKKIKNFKNGFFKIKEYSNKIIIDEAKLFLDWYLPDYYREKKAEIIKKKFLNIFRKMCNQLKNKNNIFVHRDFHVSNIMIHKKNFFIIDSQDALFGNITYDLASLIDDVRIKTSKKFKDKIYRQYFLLNKKKINREYFKNDFLILSILRNFKIIGIFKRLDKRDNKRKYLKLIPYAWKLIEERMDERENFRDLKSNINKYFPKEIRYKL